MCTPRPECSVSSLTMHIAHSALSDVACATLYMSYRLEFGIHLHKDTQNCCALLQIDYINLTYTSSGMDVYEMREFLDDNNGENVKIIAKVRQDHFKSFCNNLRKPARQKSPLVRFCPCSFGEACLSFSLGAQSVQRMMKEYAQESLSVHMHGILHCMAAMSSALCAHHESARVCRIRLEGQKQDPPLHGSAGGEPGGAAQL